MISFITSLYLLVIHPSDASNIGHTLNEFEKRQLIDWTPKFDDFLKHDDENRTYGDVFGTYRSECDNYSTCVFPRAIFTHPYESDYALLKPMQQGMRFLELGCGSGAAADYFASRCNVEIMCVTNSTVQADLCRWKSRKCNGRVQSFFPTSTTSNFRRSISTRSTRSSRSATQKTWTPCWRAVGDRSSLEDDCLYYSFAGITRCLSSRA